MNTRSNEQRGHKNQMRMRKKEQHNNCHKEKGSEYLQKSPRVPLIRIPQSNNHFEPNSREK